MLEMNIQTRGSYFFNSGPDNLGFGRWELHYTGFNTNLVCSAIPTLLETVELSTAVVWASNQ
jgi:hypothetical protein